MKIKTLVPKKLKYKPITAKPLKYLKIAVDKDGDGIPQFLDCNDHSAKESGVLHDWLKKQRLLQERKHMAKLDIEPTESEQEYFNEELSKSETSIENFKTKVEERTGYWKENIQAGFKGTDRNFSRIARAYDRKPAYQMRNRTPKGHPQESNLHPGHMQVVNYLINPPPKLFIDSSTPDLSYHQDIPRYEAFHPPTTGKIFKPISAPLPKYLQRRREREFMRLLLRQKLIDEAKEVKE